MRRAVDMRGTQQAFRVGLSLVWVLDDASRASETGYKKANWPILTLLIAIVRVVLRRLRDRVVVRLMLLFRQLGAGSGVRSLLLLQLLLLPLLLMQLSLDSISAIAARLVRHAALLNT